MSARRIGTLIDGLHVRVDGPADGRAIVLIHGFAGSMLAMSRLAELLADKYRVIRVDLLGHGHSKTADDLDAPAQATAIDAALTELQVKDVIAVGHSFGGDVAAELASSFGASAVVVIGQAPDYSYSKLPSGAIARFLPLAYVHRFIPAAAVRFSARSTLTTGSGVIATADDPDAFGLDFAAMNPAMYKTILVTRPQRLKILPLDIQLRDCGIPAMEIHGDRDAMWDWRKTVARYESAGITVKTVAGTGHSPHIERPATVATMIRDFAERA